MQEIIELKRKIIEIRKDMLIAQDLYSEKNEEFIEFRRTLIETLNILGRWRFGIVKFIFPEIIKMSEKLMLVKTSFYWNKWYGEFNSKTKEAT